MRQCALAEVAQCVELLARVVDATDERVLVGGTATGLVHVLAHGVVQVDQGVLLDARHERVASGLHCGVQGDGQRELLRLLGKADDVGDDAAGGDREVTGANAAAVRVVELAQGAQRGVVVHERLALAHEDDAGHARVEVIAHVHDLLVDLCGREGAREASGAGGAEGAAHGTSGLRAGADSKAVLGGHADALDGDAVGVAQQVLAAAVRRDLAGNLLHAPHADLGGKCLAQCLGQVGHLVKRTDVLVPEPVLDLLGAETRLSQGLDELRELLVRERLQVDETRGRPRITVGGIGHDAPLSVASPWWSILNRVKPLLATNGNDTY